MAANSVRVHRVLSLRRERVARVSSAGSPRRTRQTLNAEDVYRPPSASVTRPSTDHEAPFPARLQVQTFGRKKTAVAVVHCKAGKGRTGCIISCLLVRLSENGTRTPNEALRKFAVMRTHNEKGVTIPSQMRYVQSLLRILLTIFQATLKIFEL